MNDFNASAGSAPGRLGDYGWNSAVAARFDALAQDDGEPVRIVRVDRASCVVMTGEGQASCRLRRSGLDPVTGDWAWARRAADGVLELEAVAARTTAVERVSAGGGGSQTLVANVDRMFVLHGVDRPHRVGRLERLCILSLEAGVPPVVVVTKVDLLGTPGAVIGLADAVAEIRSILRDVEIRAISATTGAGLDELYPHLVPGLTVGMVGESGAGKTTLVNRLAGTGLTTGPTRRSDRKGRHTTTARHMVTTPAGALLVDTPGLRSISMPPATQGLDTVYDDISDLAQHCRFRDCAHEREPGCAVQVALRDGRLTQRRWAAYRKLRREMSQAKQRVTRRAQRSKRGRPRHHDTWDESW